MQQQVKTDPGVGLEFLDGGGAMGERIRAYPWARTSLGEPQYWPQGLRTAVRVLLTTQHPMFIFWGHTHTCLYNDAYCRSLGAEKHPSILGAPARESWEEIWPIIGPQIEHVMRGEGATWHENQLVPIIRDGELQDVYCTYSFSPIDEPDFPHGVGGVLVICTETTERVLAERRHSAERERFAQLFAHTPTFLALLRGPDHVIELANPGYLKLAGHRPVVGRKVADTLPEAAAQGYLALLDAVYRTGKPFSALGSRYSVQASPDGPVDDRYLDFFYQPMTDPDGCVTGILVQGVDVTARAEAELNQQHLATLNDQLREQDRRKNEFLATLAHELRNPLAPIRNAVELCARSIPPDSLAHPAIGIVKRQVNQLSRLVDDLLDVSRISQGRVDLKMEIVEVDKLIDMARETVAPLMREKQHELSIIHANEPVYVKGDASRLVQALANVLNNAAKYTDAHGHIRVRVEGRADLVAIDISDNGAGISADLLPHVFELFTQSDRTLDRAQGGLGIGLSIVKQLIEMHGGQCVARSAGVGQGSTFEITLPRSKPSNEAAADPVESSRPRRRILIIDDNVDAATSLAEILRIEGHDCEALFSGHEALERAATLRPDFVLLDIGLPDLEGYEVARRLRQIDGLEDVGLIAVTGYGQPHDLEQAQAAGFDGHFIKPLDIERLERALCQGR